MKLSVTEVEVEVAVEDDEVVAEYEVERDGG